jgi:hypothetical protein
MSYIVHHILRYDLQTPGKWQIWNAYGALWPAIAGYGEYAYGTLGRLCIVSESLGGHSLPPVGCAYQVKVFNLTTKLVLLVCCGCPACLYKQSIGGTAVGGETVCTAVTKKFVKRDGQRKAPACRTLR